MLPVNTGGHAAYQNFVAANLRKFHPNPYSLTDWAAQLKMNPLYAILSGFEFGDTPGVGTFYDFPDCLWDSDSCSLSPHEHSVKKKKVKKPKHFQWHSDSYVCFSCLFLFLSDNIYFSKSVASYAGYNHSRFREII